MSDDETRFSADLPIEPVLLPEGPFASPREGPELVASPREPRASQRPRVWTVWVVFIASQIVNLSAVAVILVALTVWMHGAEIHSGTDMSKALVAVSISPVGLLGTVWCTMVIFAGAAITAAAFSPVGSRERLRLRAAGISPFAVVVNICGVLGIGLVFGALMALGALPESPAIVGLDEFIRRLSPGWLVVAVLVLGLAPGIAEELLFRGYVQTRFSQRWGPGWGILWTSLLFGVMHMDLVHGMFAVGLGIYLGYLTERTGSIRPAMICHAANNTISVLTAAWSVEIVGVAANVAGLVGGIVILSLAVGYLRTFVKPYGSEARTPPVSGKPGES